MIATTCYTEHVFYHKQTFLTEKKKVKEVFLHARYILTTSLK